MIIFEGPDGAGKTSLAVRLSKDLGIPMAPKVVSSDMTALTDLATWTEQNVSGGFQYKIFDRHRLISEPIYGPATRSRQDLRFLDPGWMMEMMARFYACDPIIIYCLPPLHVVRENVFRDDTDNEAVRGRIAAIYAGYAARSAIDLYHGKARLFNYKTSLYDDMLRWLQRELTKRNENRSDHRSLAGRRSAHQLPGDRQPV